MYIKRSITGWTRPVSAPNVREDLADPGDRAVWADIEDQALNGRPGDPAAMDHSLERSALREGTGSGRRGSGRRVSLRHGRPVAFLWDPLFRPMAGKSIATAAGRAIELGSVHRDIVRRHAERSELMAEVEGCVADCAEGNRAWFGSTPPHVARGRLGHASLTATAQFRRPPPSDEDAPAVGVSCPKERRR